MPPLKTGASCAFAAAFVVLSWAGAAGYASPERAAPAATEDEETKREPATDTAALERAYQNEPDDKKRAALVYKLTGAPTLLARIVREDRSDDVALAAAYALRRTVVGNVVGLLDRRLQTGARDPAARERMMREIERHQVFAAGQNLPHFLREAPPVFTVKGASHRSARVLAFGDFGDGSERQARMAEAMRGYHAKNPFDVAVTVGDNFYPAGMAGPDDPRWDTQFDRLYGSMGIRVFASLGNHDWVLADSPASEIAHQSGHWRMPADRYTFVAGPVQFFAIDTNLISHAQLAWLDREIGRSTARWKVVYGHHPIYSDGAHGDETGLRDALMPILRGRVNVYLCGHDHDMQHIAPEDGVHFVLVGGGGAQPRPVTPGGRSLFAVSKNGFGVIDATRSALTVTFVSEDLSILNRFTIPAAAKPTTAK
jgi:tartrate-resistant acid phosphatase type 5